MRLFKRNNSCCICGTEYYKPLFSKWIFKKKNIGYVLLVYKKLNT